MRTYLVTTCMPGTTWCTAVFTLWKGSRDKVRGRTVVWRRAMDVSSIMDDQQPSATRRCSRSSTLSNFDPRTSPVRQPFRGRIYQLEGEKALCGQR